MSNYNSLKTTINANVKQNGVQAITGQILNSVLNAMVNTLGTGYQFMGTAVPATSLGTPDQKVFWFATEVGDYTNSLSVAADDGLVVFYYDSSWHKMIPGVASADQLNQLDQEINGFVLSGVSSSYLVIFQNGLIPTGTIIQNTGDVQLQLADGNIGAGTNEHRQNLNPGTSWLSTFDITYARTATGSGNYGLTMYGSFVSYAKNQNLPDGFKTIARQNIDAPKTSDLNVFVKKTQQTLSASESEQVAANLNMTDTWAGSGAGIFVSQKGIRNGVNLAQQEKGYRICSSGRAATQKIVVEDGTMVVSATKNMVFLVKFTWTNTANEPTLKFEHSEEHPFYYYGSPVTATNCWKAGDVLLVWYDGTNYQSVCVSDEKERLDFLENNRTQIFNPTSYAKRCFHHDNFARTEQGYAIGKNSGDGYSVNGYEYVDDSSYDDGLVVDNGATFAANSSRAHTYSLRKIAAAHTKFSCIETNAPTDKLVCFAWNVVDINNFDAIRCSTYITASDDTIYTRYTFDYISVVGGNETIKETKYFRVKNMNFGDPASYELPKLMQLYFVNGDLHIYLDGGFAAQIYVGEIDEHFCLCARKNQTYKFDFVNQFNIEDKRVIPMLKAIDNNNESVPFTKLDAGADNYEIVNTIKRWSPYAEHFIVHDNDTPIANGIRSERGLIVNPSDANSTLYPFCLQLRDIDYKFDVLFPSTAEFDTAQANLHDTFWQMHDAISISSRGDVPLTLALIGDKACIRQTSTTTINQGSVDVQTAWEELFTIVQDKWYHVQIKLHERYDARQNPYIEIIVDGQAVYKSYLPNCYNDPVGGFPKYGEYKNGWGIVTSADRYFDNVKMVF